MAERAKTPPGAGLWLPPAILVVSGAAAFVILGTSWQPARAVLAATILCLGPGAAFVPLARLGKDRLLGAVVVLLVSIAVDICVAQAITYGWGFTWRPCAIVILSLTVLGACVQILERSLRSEGRSS